MSDAAIGSVWNKGNWHWESHSINEHAVSFLRTGLRKIITGNSQFVVKTIDVPFVSTDAEVSLRKNKHIVVFDLKFTTQWRLFNKDIPSKFISGSMEVKEVLPDDVDTQFHVDIKVDAGASKAGIPVQLLNLVSNEYVNEMYKVVRSFAEEINNHVLPSVEVLKAAQVRNEEEEKERVSAMERNAQLKEAMLKDQLTRERELIRKAAVEKRDAELQKLKELREKEAEEKKRAIKEAEALKKAQALEREEAEARRKQKALAEKERLENLMKKEMNASTNSPISSVGNETPSSAPNSSSNITKPKKEAGGFYAAFSKAAKNKSTKASSGSDSPVETKHNSSLLASSSEKSDEIVTHDVRTEGLVTEVKNAPRAVQSVWNPTGFMWEQKDFTPWAKGRLQQLLAGIDIDVPGAHIRMADVKEVRSDAEISIRRGRKIVIFEMQFNVKFEGELIDENGKLCGAGDGEVIVDDLDQDSTFDSYRIIIRESSDGGPIDKKLTKLMQKWGERIVREKVWAFVEEIKNKE